MSELIAFFIGWFAMMFLWFKTDYKIVAATYHKGYEQGKADAAPKWTSVTEKLPEEHDTMFVKYWGTDRWNNYMFRKKSDLVEVTVELEDGTRHTDASRTYDGEWDVEEKNGFVHMKVVAWHYMSEPWKGNVDAEVQNDKN